MKLRKIFNLKGRDKDSAFFVLKQAIGTVIITLIVMSSLLPVSCRLTEDGIELYSGDVECPKIEKFEVISSNQLQLVCSKKFSLVDAVCQLDGQESQMPVDVIYDEDHKVADIHLCEETYTGLLYYLTGTVKDETGNSLSFRLDFTGYNDHPAQILFSEIRTQYSGSSNPVRSELIEFYVNESGNLSGLEVISANYGEEKKYSFPSVEVEKGEIIVLHYRAGNPEECIDETGWNIGLAAGPESTDTARDFWVNSETKLLTRNDVVVVKNRAGNEIVDILPMCESSKSAWAKDVMKEYIQQAIDEGVWNGDIETENAVCADSMSDAHTLARKSYVTPGNKDQWYITSSTSGTNKIKWTIGALNN